MKIGILQLIFESERYEDKQFGDLEMKPEICGLEHWLELSLKLACCEKWPLLVSSPNIPSQVLESSPTLSST